MNTSPEGLRTRNSSRARGQVGHVVDDHRQKREIELGRGRRNGLGAAVAVRHARMGATALGVVAHLRRGLDGDDARVEGVGEHHGEASGAGAQVEDDRRGRRGAEAPSQRLHPEPTGLDGQRAPRAIRAVQPQIVIDAPYHKASGSGSPSNA
jgi:hypothetical protein